MDDGSGLAEALLGLDGFVVLAATESTDELVVTVETTAFIVDCTRCGTRAEGPHLPMPQSVDAQASLWPLRRGQGARVGRLPKSAEVRGRFWQARTSGAT